MRRDLRERPSPGMFRGSELLRLVSGIAMLVLVVMLMMQFRDPGMWRWLTGEEQEQAKTEQPAAPEPEPPPATGPTDEDPEQADAAREEYQAVTDGALTLGPEEMEAYDRLVYWVENQSFERLWHRARSDLLFTHFHDESDRHRGQLVTLDLNVRRILDAGKNRDGVQLYEVWGFTTESRDRLYVMIVPDLPKGMPIGPSVYEKARFAGYYYKLQGYHPFGAMPGAVPDKSPLLVGRLQWIQTPALKTTVDQRTEWMFSIVLLTLCGIGLLFWMVVRKWIRRKPLLRSIPQRVAAPDEVIPIEKWLEQANRPMDRKEERSEENEQM